MAEMALGAANEDLSKPRVEVRMPVETELRCGRSAPVSKMPTVALKSPPFVDCATSPAVVSAVGEAPVDLQHSRRTIGGADDAHCLPAPKFRKPGRQFRRQHAPASEEAWSEEESTVTTLFSMPQSAYKTSKQQSLLEQLVSIFDSAA